MATITLNIVPELASQNQKQFTLPYAEIVASLFYNSRFGLLLGSGLFNYCFEFGSIQNIVSGG